MDVSLDESWAWLKPGRTVRTSGGRSVRIDAPLGSGNEGVVFRGLMHGEPVAVKFFKRADVTHRERRTQALASMDLARSLSPCIAGPFESIRCDGHLGHVAPLVRGVTVQELAEQPTHLVPRQRLIAAIKLGALITLLHKRGLAFGDLNKGAVKLDPQGASDVSVALVDLDSLVMPGQPAPLTLGTPDTSAPELREGRQPSTVAAWQAADWTAYGHVVLELLLAKTAACGIDEPMAQVDAFLGVPPCLLDSPRGRAIDAAAGLPAGVLPASVRRALARLFHPAPAKRDGRAFVQALAAELVNNHQVGCARCGLQYLVHPGIAACPGCGHVTRRAYEIAFPNGSRHRLSDTGVSLGRRTLNDDARLQRVHARLFTLGGVPFISAFAACALHRQGLDYRLPIGLHVPVQRGDRISLNTAAEVLVL